MSKVEEAILKTIVYYDSFDYPLTFEELNTFLFSGSKEDVNTGLESLIGENLLEESNGFYFLKNRKKLVEVRKERNEIAEKKWRKTLKTVKWFRMIPYLRLVFASGSLALKNTVKESDLDVLIVVKHGRIWTVRFLVILLLSLLGVRRTRHERVAPDKICLNHFITDKSLYIPRKSIYTAQLYARLALIWTEDEKIIDQFCTANSWVGEYVRGWPEAIRNPKFKILNPKQIQNSKILNLIKKTSEIILDTKAGGWLETILKKYQLRRINSCHLTYKPDGRVKADDESLEFHPDSPELKIIEKYNKKIIELGFKDLTERSSFAK
ncbi:MAG: hypothetical protein AAB338_00115 [Patescibacteria group bacterium]